MTDPSEERIGPLSHNALTTPQVFAEYFNISTDDDHARVQSESFSSAPRRERIAS